MSTITNWNPEQTRVSMRNATDAFVDAVEPHFNTAAKAVIVGGVIMVVNACGEVVKTGITNTFSVASPVVNAIIDGNIVPIAIDSIKTCSSGVVDSCTKQSTPFLKQTFHKTTDSTVNLYSRSISLFK